MSNPTISAESLQEVLGTVDSDLSAVLGPSSLATIAERVMAGETEGEIVHDFQSGENFPLIHSVHDAVQVLTIIKICIEILIAARTLMSPQLADAARDRVPAALKKRKDFPELLVKIAEAVIDRFK